MADRQFLERIDRHMARGNELMGRIDSHMLRGNELMERVEEEMRLTREFHATVLQDFRQFVREMIGRLERGGREQSAELRRLARETADLRGETRAQTQALLRVIDRLDRWEPGGSGATA